MEQRNTFFRQLSISLLCFIIFFSINLLGLIVPAKGNTGFILSNETDYQALLAIKYLIPVDPLGAFSSWNHSIRFCNWQGVSCGRRHQRVTVLNLSSLALVGSVSPQIGNLTFLRTIDLRNNSFHGEIPQELGKLFRLQYLLLFNNSFQGEFPTNLTHCSDFRVIDLSNNNLGGHIPTEVGSLSNLFHLNLAMNHFMGTIPLSIANISSLRVLSLVRNNLEGNIPIQLGQLSKLEHLQLSANNLSGMVPTPLYNISSIHYFSIAVNLLHGILPLDLGFILPNLQTFLVGGNQFHGPIPSSIANATRLVQFEISENSFTGSMPMNLGTLDSLEILRAFSNSLGTNEGNELNFITSLSNCSNLKILDLAINRFSGLLPHSIANLSNTIIWLTLDKNYISGTIPVGIGNLVNLHTLYLDHNMLTGSIPESIGKLSMLEQLKLLLNNISGEIPSSIGNLTRLGILHIQNNMIEGSIPVSLGNCSNLQSITLGYNHLTGVIPQPIFGLSSLIYLSLSQNYLTGLLPQEVSLKNLGELFISENKLFGEIPPALGSCEVLELLNIKGNLFEGTIPTSFKQLRGLQILDVSRNNLSGQIPRFLAELPFLQNLNLSFNMFDGEVPDGGVFRNISAFSIVGNNRLCGGIKALQLPTCPTKILQERKRTFTPRVIALVATLTVSLLLVCFLAILYRTRRSRQQTSSTLAFQNQYLQLSYGELLQATDGFSTANLIGKGGHGSVYKGFLNSGELIVAVKVLNIHEHGANRSFVAECEALKNIRHRNLVKVITSCSSIDFKGNDFKALVFEFMTNGSLESWLHQSLPEQDDLKNLNFVQRLNIIIDVASALDYLHRHCEVAIIHCDLKPSNILLDDDLCAHVGDFGLARILSATISNHQQSSSICIRGTVGYVAPEYGMGEEVSTQGDMYSYGVLLLEMFTRKRPTDSMFIGNINLHNYAKMFLPDQVTEIVDPKIIMEEEDELSRIMQNSSTSISALEVYLVPILQIGVSCSSELPSERMTARDVLRELHKIRNVFLKSRRQGR
ncbi:putative LRR receptor-like serine/threonine-protein kinase [Camellia lanceoleosa]|uniref:LRR receptor-like serine/threonine-protein kinase n=1 Tax=Camellia lanceoleosa TaxID=1840588 RepID=A0ACC0G3V0_9ERIC|nr:putative LRR receptor-like serine/threonine-protein kinase [Camellia lanceoleosa]